MVLGRLLSVLADILAAIGPVLVNVFSIAVIKGLAQQEDDAPHRGRLSNNHL
jgi:hypothetical protein